MAAAMAERRRGRKPETRAALDAQRQANPKPRPQVQPERPRQAPPVQQAQAEPGPTWCDQCQARVQRSCASPFCRVAGQL